MKPLASALTGLLALLAAHAAAAAAAPTTETIVLIRHGEKPEAGLGQLDCQGLNRALALPAVIKRAFGRPDAVFAPDPAHQKDDDGQPYDYVRPLATVEPTAIASGLPVHTQFGVSDLAGLRAALERPAYRRATILVGWEHREIVNLARAIMGAHGGDRTAVPEWQGEDFDSIFVIRLAWTGDAATATFERAQEGLDGRPTTCPG